MDFSHLQQARQMHQSHCSLLDSTESALQCDECRSHTLTAIELAGFSSVTPGSQLLWLSCAKASAGFMGVSENRGP